MIRSYTGCAFRSQFCEVVSASLVTAACGVVGGLHSSIAVVSAGLPPASFLSSVPHLELPSPSSPSDLPAALAVMAITQIALSRTVKGTLAGSARARGRCTPRQALIAAVAIDRIGSAIHISPPAAPQQSTHPQLSRVSTRACLASCLLYTSPSPRDS